MLIGLSGRGDKDMHIGRRGAGRHALSAQVAVAEPPGGRGALPWGPKQVLLGVLGGMAVVAATNALFFLLVLATGSEFSTRDAGDLFEKAGEIARVRGRTPLGGGHRRGTARPTRANGEPDNASPWGWRPRWRSISC